MAVELGFELARSAGNPPDNTCQCETEVKEVSMEQYAELSGKCWFGEDPEACADLTMITDKHGHFESHMDASGRAWLDLLEIEDVDGDDRFFFNPTYNPILWNPATHAIMWGRQIDTSVGKAVTGGESNSLIGSYISKIQEDPWAAAPLVSYAITANPVPGLAVYGISKLF